MLKISKRASTFLSQILSILVLVLLIGGACTMPLILRFFMNFFSKPESFYTPVLMILYVAFVPAFAADIALLVLICNIKADDVFCAKSVSCLRLISWCCFAEGIIFFALGFFLTSAFAVTFAAFFMGIILRVVKNVIEQATIIKSENDFTI